MYSNAVYGNDVVYIMCNAEELDSVPIMDGQIIVLRNSSGMYYDVGSVRHYIGGVEVVSTLPDKGKRYTLYVVVSKGTCDNIYVCTGSQYIPLIPDAPEQVINEDAPDNVWDYIRVHGSWKRISHVFRFEPSETLSANIKRFNTWSKDIAPNTLVHIQGQVPFQSNNIPLVFDKSGFIYDFQDCDLSVYMSKAYDAKPLDGSDNNWSLLKISNSYGIQNLCASRVNIEFSNTPDNVVIEMDHCHLTDSRISFNERNVSAIIENCYFEMTDADYVPIIESNSINVRDDIHMTIQNNMFITQSKSVGCALYGISTYRYNVHGNGLHNCIALYRMIDRNKVETLAASFMPDADISNDESISDYCFIDTKAANYMQIFEGVNYDWKFLKWVCHNSWVRKFLSLGDVLKFSIDDSNFIYLGVAEFSYNSNIAKPAVVKEQSQPNVVFELNPMRCTTYSDVNSAEFQAIGQKYFSPIARTSPEDLDSVKSMKLMPMFITDMKSLEEVDTVTWLKQTHVYLTARLMIYSLGVQYDVSKFDDGTSRWALYDSESVFRCFVTPDGFIDADSESFDNSSIQHFRVDSDGNVVTTTSLTNSDDIRFMIAL